MKAVLITLLALGGWLPAALAQTSQVKDPAALEARLKQQPGDLNTMMALAKAYLQAARYDDAAQLYEDVISSDFDNFSAHFGLGLALYRKGDLRGSIFEFEQATRVDPKRFEGWYNLGVAYSDAKRWDAAAEAFSRALEQGKALKLDPQTLKPAYLGLAAAERKLGKPDAAASALQKAAKELDSDQDVLFLLAENLVLAGHPKDAIPYLYDVLNEDRANVAAVNLLADIYVGQGLAERALHEIDRSLAEARSSVVKANLLLKKALIVKAEDAKEASRLLQQASALDPQLWQAHYDLGSNWLKAGDAQKALRSFQQAYSVKPDEPKILVGLATAYLRLQDYKQAYRYAKLASTSSDKTVRGDALILAGKSAYQLGRYGESRALLVKAVDLEPHDADAWLWLGLASYAMKDYKTAIAALERSVNVSPTPLAKLNLGAAYLAVKRFSDAEQILTQVVLEDPQQAEAWYNLGWALKSLARDAEAKRAWKRALELGYEPARSLIKN